MRWAGGAGGGTGCWMPLVAAGVREPAAEGSSTCDANAMAEEAVGEVALRTSSTSACVSPICLDRLCSSVETCVLNMACASARLVARACSSSNLDKSFSSSAARGAERAPQAHSM